MNRALATFLVAVLGLLALGTTRRAPVPVQATIKQGWISPSEVASSHEVLLVPAPAISLPVLSFTLPIPTPLRVNPCPCYLQKRALLL